MLELLFLLLPIAAGYGWFMGRNSIKQKQNNVQEALSNKYSTGLNYLLSNQQDRAIDYLIEALQVEEDSIEAHFAMANLMRRRGEFDRALKIHEFLVRQGSLPDAQKHRAIYELAKDYHSAGLLDRATTMFEKLVNLKAYQQKSLIYLLQIFQSTKDWEQGIALKKAIVNTQDKKLKLALSNFYCEEAEKALQKGLFEQAITQLDTAIAISQNSSRANLMLAQQFERQEAYELAKERLLEIFHNDFEYFPEVLNLLEDIHLSLEQKSEFYMFLHSAIQSKISNTLLKKYTEYLLEERGVKVASEFLLASLRKRPTIVGFKYFINTQVTQPHHHEESKTLQVIKGLVAEYIEIHPRFQCRNCGFRTNIHYWSCPSCHDWEQIKPVRGFEGE